MAKLTKIGNSLGVTIPREAIEALGLKQGDEVEVRCRGSLLEVVPVVKRPRLRPELQQALDETVAEYGATLRELAK